MVPQEVPIGKLEYRGIIFYPNNAPEVNYKQRYECGCFWGILGSDSAANVDFYAEESVSSIIKESLQSFSSIKQGHLYFACDIILSWKYLRRKG